MINNTEKVHRNSIKITVDFWRSRRDSNPRTAFDRHTISSRARYDHFDTAPYSVVLNLLFPLLGGARNRLIVRRDLIIIINTDEKIKQYFNFSPFYRIKSTVF